MTPLPRSHISNIEMRASRVQFSDAPREHDWFYEAQAIEVNDKPAGNSVPVLGQGEDLPILPPLDVVELRIRQKSP